MVARTRSAFKPRRWETPEDVERQRKLLVVSTRLLSAAGIHGIVRGMDPDFVRLQCSSSISAVLGLVVKGFIRPTGRWRLYHPGNDDHPPVCFRIQMHKEGRDQRYVMDGFDVSWVEPPTNISVKEVGTISKLTSRERAF